MQNLIILLFLGFFIFGCSSNDKQLNDESPASEQFLVVNKIQSQSWCMERVRFPYINETLRLNFDESLDHAGKKRIKFDRLLNHSGDWVSYDFDNNTYPWDIADRESSISLDKIYLSLISNGKTIGSENYLEVTTYSSALLSDPISSSIFKNCSEDLKAYKKSDRSDYALFIFKENNLYRNREGYIPWDLKFPTININAKDVYDQYWCQSDYKLDHYRNSVNILKFTESGKILHSKTFWDNINVLFKDEILFETSTNLISQKFIIDEQGQMKIYLPQELVSKSINVEDYIFNVEFRTDGERMIMITHDYLNNIFYKEKGSLSPSGLSNQSVYYNCSSVEFAEKFVWEGLKSSLEPQMTELLNSSYSQLSLLHTLPSIN